MLLRSEGGGGAGVEGGVGSGGLVVLSRNADVSSLTADMQRGPVIGRTSFNTTSRCAFFRLLKCPQETLVLSCLT